MLPRRTRRYAAWAMAACVALLVAVGVYWWTQPVAYHAPPGSRLTVHLPDGSEAVLNAGTTLRHARSFDGGIRAVSLSGEAFFDVRRDETRPFRIETFNATIHVLGTAFNVRAHPDDTTPTTAVTVESGRVRVQPLSNDAQAVVLEAGQAATVRPDLRTPELVSVSPQQTDVALWRAGGVYLSDVPLTDIFDELERRYNVEIDSDTPAVRGVRRTYHRDPDRMPPTVEPLLEELCVTAGLRYRATANGFIVYDAD